MEHAGRRPSRLGRYVALACLVLLVLDAFGTALGVIHPVLAYFAFALGFATLVSLAGSRVERRRQARVAALAGVFVASLAFWPWGGRKAFFRDADGIEIGMARGDVRARMEGFPMWHPYGPDWRLTTNSGPSVDVWSHAPSSFDHVIVQYDAADRVHSIERLVD